MTENFGEFILELIKYYKVSMDDISKSIEGLAEIQEKYSDEYEKFQEIAENPELLLNLKIDDKVKSIFFELLLKSSTLTQKVNRLITLTPTEKKSLAKDLKAYVQELERRFKELSENVQQ